MISPVAIGTLMLAAGGAAYYFMQAPRKDLRDRIAAIDAGAGVDMDARANTLLRRLLDERRSQALSVKLQEAGWYDVTPQIMFQRSVIGMAIGLALGLCTIWYFHQPSPVYIVLAIALAAYAAYMPYASLYRAIDKRKIAIHRELPDFLDVLATTVDAGIALNGALAAATNSLRGPLGEEMRAALQDIRLGRSRTDALMAVSQRARDGDLTTTMIAIVQSERLGASITDVLQQLAGETRERRFMRAEELAAQLPNKLVFPVGLCMLPALLLLIFGAVIAKLLT
jgi:tight adherence protein C